MPLRFGFRRLDGVHLLGPPCPPNHELNLTERTAVHHQALRAAASVALAFSAGCAGARSVAPGSDPGLAAAAPAGADTLDSRIAAVRAPLQGVCGPDGELQACCDQLGDACSAEFGPDSTDLDVCLFGPGADGSHGCTPWGPPVPPAMS